MIDISAHTIKYNEPISLALEKLNLPYHLRTVFVLNSDNQVMGTITDGDIRRGLLSGIDFNQNVENFAFKNFKFILIIKFKFWIKSHIKSATRSSKFEDRNRRDYE